LLTAFTEGATSAVPGHIWVLDTSKKALDSAARYPTLFLRKMEIEDFKGAHFQPHGIYVSLLTDLIYAVNHAGEYSSVEIFSINYGSGFEEAYLVHLRTIRSKHFPLYGINDVIEGGGRGEFYVTQWLPFGFPEGGSHNPTEFRHRIEGAVQDLNQMVGLSTMTQTFRCTWGHDDGELSANCQSATGKIFLGANGITVSSCRSQVFVNDLPARRITIFDRDTQSGDLTGAGTIKLPFSADNVEFVDGELHMGSIPIMYRAAQKMFGTENINVPGGLMVAKKGKTGNWTATDVLEHDGTLLSQISAGIQLYWQHKVILGSPFSDGILLCPAKDASKL